MKGPELLPFPDLLYSSENNLRMRSIRPVEVVMHTRRAFSLETLLKGAACKHSLFGIRPAWACWEGGVDSAERDEHSARRAGSGPRVLGWQRTERPGCACLKQTTFFSG